jgi:hypothetical protein
LSRIDSVQVDVLSPDPSRPPRLAIWLVAWLAGQLGWKSTGAAPNRASSESGSTVRATFLGPAGDVSISILTRGIPPGLAALPRLLGVTITIRGEGPSGEGAERFQLERRAPDSPAISIRAESHETCRLPRLVNAPELEPACRVAAALESSRLDPPFQNALPIAVWLMESMESGTG